MSLPLYQEDLFDFFERCEKSNIFPYRVKADYCLEDVKPGIGNAEESINAIKGVKDAIVQLKLNLINPSQIKFSYVVKKKGVWGLRHVICDRTMEEEEKGVDSYNTEEYSYH